MTAHAVARNAAAVRNLTETLTRWNLTDPQQRAEHICKQLTADRWAPIEPAPALRGPASSVAGRAEARAIYEQTRREKEQAE